MLIIDANIGAVVQDLDGINARLSGTGVFFRNVVRPRLLDEFAAAYREAGIGVRTGRLLESYVSLTASEHVSEINDERIIEGTEVPYAIFVEALLPVVGRIARNQSLLNEFAEQLGAYIVDGN